MCGLRGHTFYCHQMDGWMDGWFSLSVCGESEHRRVKWTASCDLIWARSFAWTVHCKFATWGRKDSLIATLLLLLLLLLVFFFLCAHMDPCSHIVLIIIMIWGACRTTDWLDGCAVLFVVSSWVLRQLNTNNIIIWHTEQFHNAKDSMFIYYLHEKICPWYAENHLVAVILNMVQFIRSSNPVDTFTIGRRI